MEKNKKIMYEHMLSRHTTMSVFAILLALGSIVYTTTVNSAKMDVPINCNYPYGTKPKDIAVGCTPENTRIAGGTGLGTSGLVIGGKFGATTDQVNRVFDSSGAIKSSLAGAALHIGADGSALISNNFRFDSTQNILSVLGNTVSVGGTAQGGVPSSNSGKSFILIGGNDDGSIASWKIGTGFGSNSAGIFSIGRNGSTNLFSFSQDGNLSLNNLTAVTKITSPSFCFGDNNCFSTLPTPSSSSNSSNNSQISVSIGSVPTGECEIGKIIFVASDKAQAGNLYFCNWISNGSGRTEWSIVGGGSDSFNVINDYLSGVLSMDGVKEYINSYSGNVDSLKAYLKGLNPDSYKNYNDVVSTVWAIYP